MVVSPAPPDSTHTTLGTPKSLQSASAVPEFQLTLSHASTPHSLYLPEISPRYKALKNTPGSLIEISPESHTIVGEFASRIGGSPTNPKPAPSGAALIIDYGPSDTIPTNSLRGIKSHQAVSPLSEPGLVDLSADVDFTALAEAAMNASEGVEVHGPVQQADWLGMMGIRQRGEGLLEGVKSEEDRKRIEGGWKRLIDRGVDGMGKVYKVMAILPENGGKRRPAGFGGEG
jgi:NADH dehydrogenase [ubiquinone] 1 alpha subcomplex assembly factor 7